MKITIIIFAIIGFIAIIERLVKFLGSLFPVIDAFNSRIKIPLAKKWKFSRLVKGAITSDVKGNVNTVVRKIEKELPSGWVKEMDIEWVKKESKKDFLEDNKMVIRMRPLEDQSLNFVIATYYFLKKALFPGTKRVIPEVPRETAVLQLCRRVIKSRRKEYLKSFEDDVLENAIQEKENILNYLNRYDNIDKFGFFTGAFIREIHEIAYQVRHNELRKKMAQEISEILKHIEYFIKEIPTRSIPEQFWSRCGPVTSYSFLLIGDPKKKKYGIEQYIRRVQEKFTSGIKRLYIFGTDTEKNFAKSVINGICKIIPDCKLMEIFELSYDYRGNNGGIGALFCLKNNE